MELDFISSENQLTDLFTKSLGRQKFEELCDLGYFRNNNTYRYDDVMKGK